MRITFTALSVAALLLALASPAAAADIRTDNVVTVPASETINDDLYVFAQTVTILGTVHGDVVAAGATITIDGTVTGSVMGGGNVISIHGPIGGSVRIAGNVVTVDAPIAGDALLAGNQVSVSANARIGRDVIAGGTSLTVTGQVARDVRGGATTLIIDGNVGRDVDVESDTLQLTSRASVGGSVSYGSAKDAAVAQGATVRGGIQRHEPRRSQPASPTPSNTLVDWIRGLVGVCILGLIMLALVPGFTRRASERLAVSPLPSLGIGCGILIAVPIFALVAFLIGLLIGGWWIGLIAIALYVVALAIALPIVSLAAGDVILQRAGQRREPAIALIIGAAIILLIGVIPIIGGLIVFLSVLVGVGAIALSFGGRGETAPVAAR